MSTSLEEGFNTDHRKAIPLATPNPRQAMVSERIEKAKIKGMKEEKV